MKTEVTVIVHQIEKDKNIVEFESPWLEQKEVYEDVPFEDLESLIGRFVASLCIFDA